MKNIQEILLKCGGVGKLILGDEEIEISVISSKSIIQQIDGFRDENMICTSLEVGIFGDDFCRVSERKA